MKLYANLHLHSTHSDGKYTPKELAKIAFDEGYKAAALTDHDTVTGNAEFMAECKKLGIESIFGIEFNAKTDMFERPNGKYGAFHITAFDFDPEYPEMKDYLEKMALRETDQTRVLFERGVEIGYIKGITWEEVLEYNKGIAWLCNEHVFRAMKAKNLITDLEYLDFFHTCFGKHRSEVPRLYDYKNVDEIIDLVHKAGGIACWAHPTDNFHDLAKIEKFLDNLIKMGIDGVEVWHRLLNQDERKFVYKLAIDRGIYISGGSDHDGLCGGEYSAYEHPETCPFYIEPLSAGTTKAHFEEIRDKKIKRP